MSDLNNHGTNQKSNVTLLFPRSSTDQNYITTCNVIIHVNSTSVYAGRVGFSSCPTSLLILDIKQLEPCMQCRAFKPMHEEHAFAGRQPLYIACAVQKYTIYW